MPKRILIDAIHPEAKRVVILENGRVQEFDSETSIKEQVKGNIYLAKVTRVEPSLQAAFIEYGGNRHGFLPFSEIHPDYYQVPVADKQKLVKALQDARKAYERLEEDEDSERKKRFRSSSYGTASSENDEQVDSASGKEVDVIEGEEPENFTSTQDEEQPDLLKKYRIQEVIKRNQIFLVQVEKEERGNKGASLTTYISLAGRYCVLMPNAHRQGGVSRRIESYEDRKRLKAIIKELNLPEEASIIVRTAGAGKSKKDIQQDYNYLASLWNKIREDTLASNAPALIYSEADVVMRAVRDLLDDDTDEILIEGEDSYQTAKQFMRTLSVGSHTKLRQYKNKVPIFTRYKVSEQITALYNPKALLESGGSIVINPTEALISIDVNSGKSTSQRDVEETALSTNMEAAYEIARQLRLRDLSGLIVIDFIDMLELKNRKLVEQTLKEAFVNDRAKIQIGRISIFGLLEMSRQRLRPSIYEINMVPCTACQGTGYKRANETKVIEIFRAIEHAASQDNLSGTVEISVPSSIASYILNFKRKDLYLLETDYNTHVLFHTDRELSEEQYIIKYPTASRHESHSGDNASAPAKSGDTSRKENIASSQANTPADAENTSTAPQKRGESRSRQRFSPKKKNGPKGGLLDGLWKKIID